MSSNRKTAARAFGQALKAARLARGITQEQLAEAGDFDRTYPSLLGVTRAA
jgi:transcriptional regulator with XRE-family HTH domain